jgi:hypothetical protein
VESLGPDLEVSEARKVRSGGLLGFFAKERFEVLAAPKAAGVSEAVHAQATAHVDQTLQALMARIEAEETPASFASSLAAAANPEWPADLADFIGFDGPPELEAGPEAQTALALPEAPVARRAGEPAWSRAELRTLGVPEGILHRLTVAEGADDQEWTMALARALLTELQARTPPAPGEPVDGLVTVSGHGPSSAVGLIRAALDGASPERLHLPAGDVPATGMELALAVRSCLPR